MSGDPEDTPSGPAPDPETPPAGWVLRDDLPPAPEGEAATQLGEAITRASEEWLKGRFGLEEDAAGQLHVPVASRMPDLGVRAEQFIKGFLNGIVARTPEEQEVAAGQRDPSAVPSGTEVVGRLLTRFSHTVTDTWRDYVAERAERESPDGKKLVDGEFVMQHGAGLLGAMLSRLGEAFKDVGVPGGPAVGPDFATAAAPREPAERAEAPAAAAAAEHAPAADASAPKAPEGPTRTPDIKVDVDLGSIFRALFTPRR